MRNKNTVQLYTYNIKYFAEDKTEKSYENLLQKFFDSDLKINTKGKTILFIRELDKFDHSETLFYFGKITKATILDDSWVNTQTKEIIEIQLPDNTYHNPQHVEFVFVPACHRIMIRCKSSFSPKTIQNFLEKGLNHIKDNNSIININIEKSEDVINEIYNAIKVKKLEVSISYTNDDFSSDYADWVDEQLKDARINHINYNATPDASGNINVSNRFVKGTLELSKYNGFAKAQIVDEQGKKSTIRTSKFPEISRLTMDKDDIENDVSFGKRIYQYLMTKFRPSSNE